MSAQVHLVDDDEAIRDALSWLLESRGISVKSWASGESYYAAFVHHEAKEHKHVGCLVLDIRLGQMSGLELFDRLQQVGLKLPVIFLTGHGDVPMAVGALKKGAFDFFEKPFDDNDLVNRIIEAMTQYAEIQLAEVENEDTSDRLSSLSERERQVMDLVLDGKLNKVIADALSISMRTVEVHRARVFEKMGVKSAVELAQRLKSLDR